MDSTEQRYLRIQSRLNQRNYELERATIEEITKGNGYRKNRKENFSVFDQPMVQIEKSEETIGATSDDHFFDRDVLKYTKSLPRASDEAIEEYKKRKENGEKVGDGYYNMKLVEQNAEKLVKRTEQNRKRNLRAMDYDPTKGKCGNFINDNNRRYVKKLDRMLGKGMEEIKQDLERGSK